MSLLNGKENPHEKDYLRMDTKPWSGSLLCCFRHKRTVHVILLSDRYSLPLLSKYNSRLGTSMTLKSHSALRSMYYYM